MKWKTDLTWNKKKERRKKEKQSIKMKVIMYFSQFYFTIKPGKVSNRRKKGTKRLSKIHHLLSLSIINSKVLTLNDFK